MKRTALLEVGYEAGFGNQLFVRGQSPFSWSEGTPLDSVGPNRWRIEVPLDHHTRVKLLLNDHDWSVGQNYLLRSGRQTLVFPYFQKQRGFWREHPETFPVFEYQVRVWIYFPPSYNQNPAKRYPVLYCQDGQNLFSDGLTTGSAEWRLDEALDGLIEAGVMDEIIVVGVQARDRLFDYTPWNDEDYGGGGARHYVSVLLGKIKPRIDELYRTIPEKNGIMGSSLGGLLAFWAGRQFPEVFQRVACLSTSFWWATERTLHEVLISDAHDPQKVYLDAGYGRTEMTAVQRMNSVEQALIADGYSLGVDLLTRAVGDGEHDEGSWGSRLYVPLRFLYPWQGDGAL